MKDLVSYARSGPVGTIVMDDGKANVMSLAMLNALHLAFDQAEKDKTVAILRARGRHFSGGFDLNVFTNGSAEDQYLMLKAGAENIPYESALSQVQQGREERRDAQLHAAVLTGPERVRVGADRRSPERRGHRPQGL